MCHVKCVLQSFTSAANEYSIVSITSSKGAVLGCDYAMHAMLQPIHDNYIMHQAERQVRVRNVITITINDPFFLNLGSGNFIPSSIGKENYNNFSHTIIGQTHQNSCDS